MRVSHRFQARRSISDKSSVVRQEGGLPKLVVQAVAKNSETREEYHALTAEEKAELIENVDVMQAEATIHRTTRQVQADITTTRKHITAEVSSPFQILHTFRSP